MLPLFIFDGETAGTKVCGFNRFQFLLECLKDLDDQLRSVGSKLFLARGKPKEVFDAVHSGVEGGVEALCFEQDCEPIWKERDEGAKKWCEDNKVEWVERVGHTLWNPFEVYFA